MDTAQHLDERLGFFVRHGHLDRIPTPWQVKAGFLVMLPITLGESDRERERSRRTWLGQVPIRVPLQLLYSPRQLMTDTGLTQSPEQLVRHLLCVYHEDAFLGYDLQLLHSHEGGLALLRDEAKKVVDGHRGWAPILRNLVAWPGYHRRLIELAEAAERFEYPDPLDLDPRFATLVGFAKFCLTLPNWPERSFYGFDLKRLGGRRA
jgi:hypothetical protein